jgi:alkanesulfonate monooxygenase
MDIKRPMRFHWSLSQAGQKYRRALATTAQTGVAPFEAQLALCRRAEQCGIDSLLMAIGFARPDPLVLSAALAMHTESVKFMVACRAGLISPTLFVQQINTLSALSNGRVHINLVAGHTPHELGYYGDFLEHDARYDRAEEFLAICRRFWDNAGPVTFRGPYYQIENALVNTPFVSPTAAAPEIFLGGSSARAADLAARHASCLFRLAREPDQFRDEASGLRESGTELGLLVSLIARPTRREAVRAAEELIAAFGEETRVVHRNFASASDSVGFRSTYALAEGADGPWRGECLWVGAVPYLGAPAIALVGSFDEVARALVEYRSNGVSQVLFMGWPDLEEMTLFGREVLPRLRELESKEDAVPVSEGSIR